MIKGKQQAFEGLGQRAMKEGAMMFKLERKNGDMEGSVRENIPGLRDWRI